MKIVSGIYKIINKINGKCYIGSSDHIFRRWRDHRKDLNKNSHYNRHLQNAWNKYGKGLFELTIQEKCNTSELLKIEQKYLDICKLYPCNYYNSTYIAGGGAINLGRSLVSKGGKMKFVTPDNLSSYLNNGWIRGWDHPASEEFRLKISAANKGKKKPPFSDEHRRKLGEASKNSSYKMTDEHKKRLQEGRKKSSYRPTDETRMKMSLKKRGSAHPLYGKHHSKETCLKLSISLKGKFVGNQNPRFDKTLYSFYNFITGEHYQGTRYDFYKKYSLNPSNVNKLLKGKIKSVGKWRLSV